MSIWSAEKSSLIASVSPDVNGSVVTALGVAMPLETKLRCTEFTEIIEF